MPFLRSVVNWLCFLPFVGLFGGVFVLDDHFTGGTGAGKPVFFFAAMGLVPIAALLAYCNGRQRPEWCLTDLLIPLFAVTGLVITYLNHPVWNAEMVILVLLVVLYFSFRVALVQHKYNGLILLLAFMATGCIEGVWGLLQLYGLASSQHALFGVTGSFFNPGPYAGYLAAALPVALYYTMYDSKTVRESLRQTMWGRYLRWGIALITLIAVVLILPATMSRAAWIAGGAGCIMVVLLYLGRYRESGSGIRMLLPLTGKSIALLVAAIVLMGVALVGLYRLKKDSADGRALIWKVSVDVVEKQWYGVGLGYFSGRYGEAQENYFAAGRGTAQDALLAGVPEYAFNEFIQVFVELGVVPFVVMLVILGYAYIAGIRRGKLAEAGSLTALLIFSTMSYPFSLLPFLVVLMFLISTCVSADGAEAVRIKEMSRFRFFKGLWQNSWVTGLLLISCGVVACSLHIWYPVFVAHKQWSKARMLYQTGSYEAVVEQYRGLLPYLGDQSHYLFEYGQALSKTARYGESMEVIARAIAISGDPMLLVVQGKNHRGLGNYQWAEHYFRKAAYRVPHRLYPYYMMAVTYDEAGLPDKALEMANRVLTKAVKIASPATQEMRMEMKTLIDRIAADNKKQGVQNDKTLDTE